MPNALNTQQAALRLNDTIAINGIFPSNNGGGGNGAGAMTIGMHHTYAFGMFMSALPTSNGQLLSIVNNQAVFSLLGTTYGGDGITDFALPNLNLRQSIGAGQGPLLSNYVMGEQSGAPTVTLTTPVLPFPLGSNQSLNESGPALAEKYLIATSGFYPGRDTGTGTGSLNYIGSIVKAAFNFVPAGYLECNGQLLSIAENSALFTILETQYGGDGITTFALPDLRGRTPVGASANHAVGDVYGQEGVTLTNANLPTNMGGSGVPINNVEPSLAITYCIAISGFFPSENSGSDNQEPFVGEVIAFAGNFVPTGFLPCDGRTLLISSNTTLFQLLGTQYGGDGQTTFGLPDLRDRSIVGINQIADLGQVVGSNQIVLTSADFPDLNYSGFNSIDDMLYGGDGNDTINGLGGKDTITGNKGNDKLFGNDDTDTLIGGDGNDFLDGGTSIDQMTGGNNDDTYAVENVGDKITELAGGGYDTVQVRISGYTLATEVERGIAWGAGNFTITGNGIANQLTGGANDDTLYGLGGSDGLTGGLGKDSLFGGDGTDTLIGGDGNDFLDGGTNIDQMTGGANNDTYAVDNLGDKITELAGGGTDTVQVRISGYTLAAEVESGIAWGAGNFTITGNAIANQLTGGTLDDTLNGLGGNDGLTGGAGADKLNGGDGLDTLIGGTGSDTLDGGADNDRFVFTTGFGTDTINNFGDVTGNQDIVQLNPALFANFAAVQAALTVSGSDVVLTSGANTITFTNSAISIFDAADFVFA